MDKNIFLDPFHEAQVFLCHSCSDHQASGFIADALEKYYNVWYSCSGSMRIGDPVLPRKELVRSDFVLFLASATAMRPTGIASAEFTLAQILQIKEGVGLGIVCVEKFELPAEHRDLLFEQFSWRSRKQDISRIIKAIREKLMADCGIVKINSKPIGTLYCGGENLERVIEYLTSGSDSTPFCLNAIMQNLEMSRVVEALKALSTTEKGNAIEKLQHVYITNPPYYTVAREQAVYILGQIARSDRDVVKNLKRRHPTFDESFLFRGYHIALSYARELDIFDNYMDHLESERTKPWNAQRDVNTNFHLLYYGGLAATLTELRTSISQGRPKNLLRLNVYTLGCLSNSKSDEKFLRDSKRHLVFLGVPAKTVDRAINRIYKRT